METIKLPLTNQPNYESHFIKYATALRKEVPKPIQEAEKYCTVVPKLKRYLFDKSTCTIKLIKKIKKKKKRVALTVVWKEKRIVTLMPNLAFGLINCICFPARSPVEELTFLCT